MDLYSEAPGAGNAYRDAYLEGIQKLISEKRADADRKRAEYFRPEALKTDPESFREDFKKMLGWPLISPAETEPPQAETVFVARDSLGSIYRMRIETLKGLRFYGLLFRPDSEEKLPLIIAQHGGGGTPELCSEFFQQTNYNDMTRRILRRGAVVFAPQLLLWDAGRFGSKFDRTALDVALKQLGGSITALEIRCIMRSLDYLASQPYVDAERIGMVGLSYGGFYTLFTAACDKRIKAAYSSCFFNNRYAYAWPDWTWFDAASKFLDAEVGALICPRALCVEVAKNDYLFAPEPAEKEFERLRAFYRAFGAENKLKLNLFTGSHELCRDNRGIDFVFRNI